MKKILSIISLIMVLAVLAATPTFALESDVPSMALDYAFDAANGVKIITVPTTAKSPLADGEIGADEYAFSWKEERDAHSLTSATHAILAADYNAAVGAKCAKEYVDMEPLVLNTEIEYFFAQDDERIYIGVKIQPGYEYKLNADGSIATTEVDGTKFNRLKTILSRAHMIYRIGFNLDDADEYIEINNNGYRWDLMVDGVTKKFTSAGVGVNIAYDGVVEQGYRQIIANETGWLNHSNGAGIVMAGDIIDQSNPATPYTVYDELVINKEALVKCMSDYSGAAYNGVPNAFFFTASSNGQVIGPNEAAKENIEESRGWSSSGGAGFFTWNGTVTKNADVSLREVFPDLIVFSDNANVTKDDVKIVELGVETEPEETEPEETEPAATEPTETEPDATEPAGSESVADTEPAAKGGCGGSVSVMGLALVATLGTCAVFTAKKKED